VSTTSGTPAAARVPGPADAERRGSPDDEVRTRDGDRPGPSAKAAVSHGTVGTGPSSPRAESIRLQLADAWGRMGTAWGVPPAVTRVHAYLMSRRAPLTEREVREALGLSHRATSQALAEAESWGLVERVAEPRRVGRRGPASVAYLAVNDPWRWFGRVVAQRKSREGDPIVDVLERTASEAGLAAADAPGDTELAELADWLAAFLAFVRLFDRAVGLVPSLEPGGDTGALPVARRGRDQRDRPLLSLLEPLRGPLPRDPPRRKRRRVQLRVEDLFGHIRASGRGGTLGVAWLPTTP